MASRLYKVDERTPHELHRRLLRSVAERIAQSSPVPVLAVRDGSSLQAWARGDKPLRVMVGVELVPTSKAALRWAAELRSIGSCELTVAQIAWPPEAHSRLGIPPPMPLDHLVPPVQETLERDLRSWAGALPGEGETRFVVSPGWGRVDTHLADLAAEARAEAPQERLRALNPRGAAARGIGTEIEIVAEKSAWKGIWHAAGRLGVDIICMATHGRSGASEVLLGSQTREVIQRARQPVLLVPPEDR